MNWSLGFKQKIKAAGLLFGAMNVILFTALSLRHTVKEMNLTLVSLYADRLAPAVDLVYLSENLHMSKNLLETYLRDPASGSASALRNQLTPYSRATGRLVQQFEQTRLTGEETRQLQTFKSSMGRYNRLERSILQLSEIGQKQRAFEVFQQQELVYFQQSVRTLHELARLQTKAGQQALEAARREASGGSLQATFLIAVVIVVGLLLLGLIQKARLIQPTANPFHLN